jgi:hypothetical protein
VRWRNGKSGAESEGAIRNVFLFLGADPATGWLAGCGVEVDKAGFVVTGGHCSGGNPLNPLRTSVGGVFAVGDVRSGSIKRVGAAIGEGAQVVAALHDYLATLAPPTAKGGGVTEPRHARRMHAHQCDQESDAERQRLRGVPEDRRLLGASAALPQLRPCRLLRRVAQQACDPRIFHQTKHPIIEGYDPPEGWGWCYIDEVVVELDQTPRVGPIRRWV